MNVAEIKQNYVTLYSDYSKKEDKIESKISVLEAQINKKNKQIKKLFEKKYSTHMPHWKEHYIKPLADELIKHFPDYHYEILGPFGLCSETVIHFRKNGTPEDNYERPNFHSISFTVGDLSIGGFSIRDYSKNTGKFIEGTIGELNGMNHPSIPIPDNADIEWFLQWVR